MTSSVQATNILKITDRDKNFFDNSEVISVKSVTGPPHKQTNKEQTVIYQEDIISMVIPKVDFSSINHITGKQEK